MRAAWNFFKRNDFWLGLITYIGVMNAFCLIMVGATGDKSNIVFESGLWFDGAKPYRDFTQVNLPMNLIILQLSHYIGSFWHFGLQQVANLHVFFVLWFCVFITAMTNRIWHTALGKNNPFSTRDVWLSGLLIWGFGQYGYAVADREFMMMALIFLYLLRFSPFLLNAPIPTRYRVLIGLLAGVGFCIKPHSILFWLAITIFNAIRHRSLKHIFYIENLILYAFTACFLLYVYLALPEYFRIIIPLALEFYGNYVPDDKYLSIAVRVAICLCLIAAGFVDWRPSQTSPYTQLIPYLLSLLLGCFIYTIVNNGWGYTMVPAWTIALIMVCIMYKHHSYILAHSEKMNVRSKQGKFGIALVVICYAINTMYPNIVMSHQSLKNSYPVSHKAIEIYNDLIGEFTATRARTFAALSVPHLPWYDLAVYSGKRWDFNINHYWMKPLDKQQQLRVVSDTEKDWRYRFMIEKTISDIKIRKPDIIFVPITIVPCKSERCDHLNVMRLLKQSPRFWQAWQQNYQLQNTLRFCEDTQETDEMCTYEVYTKIQ